MRLFNIFNIFNAKMLNKIYAIVGTYNVDHD